MLFNCELGKLQQELFFASMHEFYCCFGVFAYSLKLYDGAYPEALMLYL